LPIIVTNMPVLGTKEESEMTDERTEIKRLKEALREIMKGEGRFNRDPLIHASNTIEDMIEIAREALGEE